VERYNEDNTVVVLQKAIRKFKIKVSDTTIKEVLLAHPYYPTLKCVSDALKKWGVEHYPLKLELDEIKGLEMPFIAHLNVSGGQLVFIEKIENNNVVYFGDEKKNQKEIFETFVKKLSGAVIVLDGNKNVGEKEYKQIRQNEILNKTLLPIGVLAILLFAFHNVFINSGGANIHGNLIFWGLIITKITGLTASIFLILHEFKVHSPLADKICGFTSKTDCEEVLASNASRVFGWFNWADIGIIYFIGTLIYLLGSTENSSLGILAIICFLSLSYPVFSIYYQSVELRKWCPFCILVQFVLVAEFFLLTPSFKTIDYSGIDILRLLISFFIPLSVWLIFKAYIQKLSHSEREHYSFLQFKRNPEIFRFLLTSHGYAGSKEHKNSLILGSPNAPVTLTAFLSLYCNPCARAFKQLKSLIDNCSEVNLNIIFSVYSDEDTSKVINSLYYLYAEKGSDATIDFLDRWYSLPKESRESLYVDEKIPEGYDIALQVGNENKLLFDQHQVLGTPTIYLSGYKFPAQYKYTDIENYIDVIKQLTRGNNRQEACTISN
jgi:uncharacterized membrane protein